MDIRSGSDLFQKIVIKVPYLDFAKNVSLLMGGTLAANALGICFSPVITRLFTPENFGIFALFTTVGSILGIISTLSYDQAIVIENQDTEAISLSVLSICLILCIAILAVTAIFLFGRSFSSFFNQPDFYKYSPLLLVFIICRGGINISKNLLTRKKRFKAFASAAFIESLIGGISKIGFGIFIGASATGLIGGTIIGIVVALAFVAFEIKADYSMAGTKNYGFEAMADMAKKYFDFPKYNSWTTLINTLSQNMIILFLSIYFSPAIVGLYALTRRIIYLPVEYVADSFRHVYYQNASAKLHQGRSLAASMKKVTLSLALLSIVPFTILFLYGPTLFSIIFGPDWETSGIYARWMAPGFFFVFINRPAQIVFLTLRKLKIKMIYTTVFSIFRLLALVTGYYYFSNIVFCLGLYSTVLVAFNAWMIIMAYRFAVKETMISSTA